MEPTDSVMDRILNGRVHYYVTATSFNLIKYCRYLRIPVTTMTVKTYVMQIMAHERAHTRQTENDFDSKETRKIAQEKRDWLAMHMLKEEYLANQEAYNAIKKLKL